MDECAQSTQSRKENRNRLTIPVQLYRALKYCARDQDAKLPEPMKGTLTWDSMAIKILENAMKAEGHYPPKDIAEEKDPE